MADADAHETLPSDLVEALEAKSGAMGAFTALPPSHRREYLDWIEEAVRAVTRRRRIERTVAMVATGPTRS